METKFEQDLREASYKNREPTAACAQRNPSTMHGDRLPAHEEVCATTQVKPRSMEEVAEQLKHSCRNPEEVPCLITEVPQFLFDEVAEHGDDVAGATVLRMAPGSSIRVGPDGSIQGIS